MRKGGLKVAKDAMDMVEEEDLDEGMVITPQL